MLRDRLSLPGRDLSRRNLCFARRTARARLACALAIAAAALSTAGCRDEAERNAVPHSLAEEAHLPGYTAIRFWGDKDTPAFEDALKHQLIALKAAAAAGKMPEAEKRADVLAISGGGDQGAFGAGYLKGWSERGTRPTFATVTGVSTGALAAPFAFLGPTHDQELKAIYTDNGAKNLYDTRWDLGVFSNALKDTAPLRAMIERYATDAFLDQVAEQYRLGRRLLVSTTNLDEERPVIWDLTAIAASGQPSRRQLFVDLLIASSAVPGIFPPVKIAVRTSDGQMHDELHVDGSVTMQMFFLPPGIKLLETEQEVFGHKRDRNLYALRNGKLYPEFDKSKDTAAALLQRGVQAIVKYQTVYNLRLLENAANDSGTQFRFMGIPRGFDDEAADKFSREQAVKLYESARAAGAKGQWLRQVPETPELTAAPSNSGDRASR